MTINPVDMQVLVPRVGEVERVNRTTQGQQQTDQQIMSQLLQENLKQKEQSVNQMLPTEQNKIQGDRKDKNKDGSKRKQKKGLSAAVAKNEEQIEIKKGTEIEDPNKVVSNTGRYLDIKI